MTRRPTAWVLAATALTAVALPGAAQGGARDEARLQRGLERLVDSRLGPPGVIATLHRGGTTRIFRAGYGDRRKRRRPRGRDHMRIASVAKAFSGAVILRLVRDGQLGLDDTVARHRPDLPAAWGRVTIRQLLGHTSGVPDYTRSQASPSSSASARGSTSAPPRSSRGWPSARWSSPPARATSTRTPTTSWSG